MKLLTAPLLFDGKSKLIENGGVLLGDNGRIAAVGERELLEREFSPVEIEDFNDCVLLPALINCHAHLELTNLATPAPEGDFIDWISGVISVKGRSTFEDYRRAVGAGARECLATGQAVVADVVSVPQLWKNYPKSPLRILFADELICPNPDRIQELLLFVVDPEDSSSPDWAGIFAHAPYTVCKEAYREAARVARKKGGFLFTHLAESGEEVIFTTEGRGGIPEGIYRDLPVSPPDHPGLHPVDWLEREGVLGPETIAVHAVNINDAHIETLAKRGVSVVLCPRSNKKLGVGVAPGQKIVDAGIPVGLGTDSSLSSGSLDLWEEVVQSVEDYGWSPVQAVSAATSGGAGVLGLGHETGFLSVGLSADIMVRRLGDGKEAWEKILASIKIEALFLAGESVGAA